MVRALHDDEAAKVGMLHGDRFFSSAQVLVVEKDLVVEKQGRHKRDSHVRRCCPRARASAVYLVDLNFLYIRPEPAE